MFSTFRSIAASSALSLALVFSVGAVADDEVNNQDGYIAQGYDCLLYTSDAADE